jgi:hypothetical protein
MGRLVEQQQDFFECCCSSRQIILPEWKMKVQQNPTHSTTLHPIQQANRMKNDPDSKKL